MMRQKNKLSMGSVLGCCAVLFSSSVVIAQQNIPSESIDVINESVVTSTVSFLASDEMRGRDTPSPELTIASSYVAARFLGARLKGLGEGGSYYQNHEIKVTKVSAGSLKVSRDGDAVVTYGLLSSSDEALDYQGTVKLLTDDNASDEKYDGPVCIVAEKFKSRRDQSNLMRRLARLKENGATAILVQVDPDHRLVGMASSSGAPRMQTGRESNSGHVVLVEKGAVEGDYELSLPRQMQATTTVRNVIGMIPGSDPELAKEAIVISAHLDHVGIKGNVGDVICNGADDNASGVTAVLSLADAFAAMPEGPKRTVIFMTFWGEEKGLLGSKYYVSNPVWPLEKTVANVNIEMIGRPEAGASGKCWSTGWDESDMSELMSVGAKEVGVLIFQHPQFSGDMLYRSSDNYPFAQKGVIAHSFSAGSLHEDYHMPGDESQKLDFRHMTKVIQGLFAGTLPMANGEFTPKKK
ncbi:MAG: M28 family peptidase [Mariniblastus sp.]